MAEKSSVRPWQGTVLGVVDIGATVILFLGGLLFLAFQGLFISVMANLSGTVDANVAVDGMQPAVASGVFGVLAGFGAVVGVVLLGLGVLYIFMARGAFRGAKWSPIVSIVLSALAILNMLAGFTSKGAVSLVVDAFILYIAIVCVKSAYYNKAK